MTNNSCMLIDGPIDGDRRVEAALTRFNGAKIIDISSEVEVHSKFNVYFRAFVLIARAIFCALPLMMRSSTILSSYPKSNLFAGTLALWRNVTNAVSHRGDIVSFEEIYANDLYCGVVALLGSADVDHIVYDSHEIQFHRNRKVGFLRITVEIGLERLVLRRTNKLIVTNYAVLDLMNDLYGKLPPAKVQYNDFYNHHSVSAPPFTEKLSLVYVGRGLSNRLLEALDGPPEEIGAELFIYPLGIPLPENLSGSFWNFGPQDYEFHLLDLMRSRPCLMWCCHKNNCLSYNYAITNKFFQALAFGVPVIAYKGTYLAKVVSDHGLGLICSGNMEFEDLLERIDEDIFKKWQDNIVLFREEIRSGEVRV